jgi:hypothetical protein
MLNNNIMPDYQKSKIYKITGGGLTYYGSTVQKLSRRLRIHINDKNYYNKNGSVNQILDTDDYKIDLIEDYPCNTKKELLEREKWWIENNVCINKLTPIQTEEEIKIKKKIYQQNHKEMSAIATKKWEDKNKEYRKEYLKNWYLKKKLNHHS